MSGRGGTGYRLDNNMLVFNKCSTSINSNSHKALRYKNLARCANYRAAKLEYNRSFVSLSPLLVISATEEQECFPVVPRCIFLLIQQTSHMSHNRRNVKKKSSSQGGLPTDYTFVPPTGKPLGWLSAQERRQEILCLFMLELYLHRQDFQKRKKLPEAVLELS